MGDNGEKHERQVDLLERELAKQNKINTELERENYSLSKGLMPASESHYYTKGDGQLSIKIRQLEEENDKLKSGLKEKAYDFKDLLGEIDKLRGQMKEKQQYIDVMESEMKARPSLTAISTFQMKI